MIKTKIEITKEEIKKYVDSGFYMIADQLRDGDINKIYRDSMMAYIDMFGAEDDGTEQKPAHLVRSAFYVLGFMEEIVGVAFLEDEIGYFFEICCDDENYYEHVAKFYNYLTDQGYPVWVPNGDKIAEYLKKKYTL